MMMYDDPPWLSVTPTAPQFVRSGDLANAANYLLNVDGVTIKAHDFIDVEIGWFPGLLISGVASEELSGDPIQRVLFQAMEYLARDGVHDWYYVTKATDDGLLVGFRDYDLSANFDEAWERHIVNDEAGRSRHE